MKRAKGDPLPYLFACAFIANVASFVLPISNPANLVMFGNNLPPLLPWLRIFLLPAGAAILATYLTMRLLFRRTLQGEVPNVLEDLRLSTAGKLTVLGVIAIAGVLLFCSATGKSLGTPTYITAFAITLFITLWDRQAPLAVGRGVSWSVLPSSERENIGNFHVAAFAHPRWKGRAGTNPETNPYRRKSATG